MKELLVFLCELRSHTPVCTVTICLDCLVQSDVEDDIKFEFQWIDERTSCFY